MCVVASNSSRMEAIVALAAFILGVTSITVGVITSKLACVITKQVVSFFALNTLIGIRGVAGQTVFIVANKLARVVRIEGVSVKTLLAVILSWSTNIAPFIIAAQFADAFIVSVFVLASDARLVKWIWIIFVCVRTGIAVFICANKFALTIPNV